MRAGLLAVIVLVAPSGPAWANDRIDWIAVRNRRPLAFRAFYVNYGDPHNSQNFFWNREYWTRKLTNIAGDHYSAVIWAGPNLLWPPVKQTLIRLEEFPEARDTPPEDVERMIKQMQWIFAEAKRRGLKNVLYTQVIFFTHAFAQTHGFTGPRPVSETVSWYYNSSYANVYPKGCNPKMWLRLRWA